MNVLIDWESLPWYDAAPGLRSKTSVRGDERVTLLEVSEGAPQQWCTQGHLVYVLAGQATLKLRAGDQAIPLQAGDTSIILDGEDDAHTVEPTPGERIQLLLFEQPGAHGTRVDAAFPDKT